MKILVRDVQQIIHPLLLYYNFNRDQSHLDSRVLSGLPVAKKGMQTYQERHWRGWKGVRNNCIIDTTESGWKAVELIKSSDFAATPMGDRLV